MSPASNSRSGGPEGAFSRSFRGAFKNAVPVHVDKIVLGALLLGLAILYVPVLLDVARTVWSRDEQGHGPIILALSLWLLYCKRETLANLEAAPRAGWGSLVFAISLLAYIAGRSQAVPILEVGSAIPLLISLLLIFKGPKALAICWFPLFFLIFMVPLPATFVAVLTTPLKSAVSAVASNVLYDFGYPVGRSGVVLTIGQYQLLVADACAGLNSMFTLEALGLLYLNLMHYESAKRNLLLAITIIPISFCANVIRVIILVLVTYHFGDAAGQGFIHGFAGMVLFMIALVMILCIDHGASAAASMWRQRRATP